ncbi:MAG: HAMP domain-containing protein [Anaerolineales bacterium]|nr:HAMP domain-containing protein [Anaerolineales bacterium]
MWTSLRVRVVALVAGVVAVALGTAYLFADRGAEQFIAGVAVSAAERDQQMAASLLGPSSRAGDVPGLQAEAERLARAMEAQILVTDLGGRVLVDSTGQWAGQNLPVGVPGGTWSGTAVQVGGQPGFVILQYGLPPGLEGPLAVELARSAPAGFTASAPVLRAASSLERSLGLAALAGGAAALALGFIFARRIVRPVEALTAAAGQLAAGDLGQRVVVRGQDELAALGRAFNGLADSLARTEQLRRQLVNDVAHELRTPLTNLRGYLEAVRDGLLQPTPEVVASLSEEAALLGRLVDDLQDLALAEAGQLRLVRRPVALAELAQSSAAALAPRLAPGQMIRIDVPDGLPELDGDPERLGQVLRNLLVNAVEHSPAGGEIRISAGRRGALVAVSVSDMGEGIPAEHLPHVFERFYRADPARARTTGGAGLGLAIVRQLVEAHGGTIQAASAVGRGSTFTFTVPPAN